MTLDALSGNAIAKELARLEQRLFQEDWAEAKARLGHEPKIHELSRTPGQRRADALVDMAARSAGNAKGQSAKPLFTVHLGGDAFRQLCELADGTVIPPGALLAWADDAEVERVLFSNDPQRLPRRPHHPPRPRRHHRPMERPSRLRIPLPGSGWAKRPRRSFCPPRTGWGGDLLVSGG